MAKGSRGRYRIASRQYRLAPYPLASCKKDICKDMCQKRCSKAFDKKEWENVTCSVCIEYPHNAVLLLCSSHDKGCRPYMCGTSFRHSNCLDQYKKACTKVMEDSISNPSSLLDANSALEKSEVTELACPLCRGQVKGWTVVEPVRDYLNAKTRNCMQDNCSFVGNYKELRKHVKAEHPLARPRDVDPDHERKWRSLEWEREREDVISTVTSTIPGAMVFGDYVIERHRNDFDSDADEDGTDNTERSGSFQMGMEAMNFFLLMHAVRQGNDLNNLSRQLMPDLIPTGQNGAGEMDFSGEDNDNDSGGVLFGRASRRRRRREAQTRIGDS
ncbi:hypothetical protein TanjilG_18111 [Lupinus angustifolius]|uniref:Uncharacterized protein n=1 Tax=Lupinus angustifolius TaxID=3871 RepID=A0A1J7HEK2_LUPAN|nr:PREDICTED: uncharacterized protein LOC109362915 [Lupinus angustifolius]XP_019464550.1 PREDICTED: uncharacterized protein LOC109362915 [Lupinus angustifolius]OIW00801.1 hypothetical protein TanjilG_18111 [Lupinus angustifolius]